MVRVLGRVRAGSTRDPLMGVYDAGDLCLRRHRVTRCSPPSRESDLILFTPTDGTATERPEGVFLRKPRCGPVPCGSGKAALVGWTSVIGEATTSVLRPGTQQVIAQYSGDISFEP